jgi:hypothetical protein
MSSTATQRYVSVVFVPLAVLSVAALYTIGVVTFLDAAASEAFPDLPASALSFPDLAAFFAASFCSYSFFFYATFLLYYASSSSSIH